MKIEINDKTIMSKDFTNTETAWAIDDASLVLEYLNNMNKVVLGGDILTPKMEHNYDSWYYNVDSTFNHQINVERSVKIATEYILKYIKLNGNAFYVVFVTE